jgi:hypothetical protein
VKRKSRSRDKLTCVRQLKIRKCDSKNRLSSWCPHGVLMV